MDFQWFDNIPWDSIKALRGTTYVQPRHGSSLRDNKRNMQCFFVLEMIRTGAMRVIHVIVKTEETQKLRMKFVLYCTT